MILYVHNSQYLILSAVTAHCNVILLIRCILILRSLSPKIRWRVRFFISVFVRRRRRRGSLGCRLIWSIGLRVFSRFRWGIFVGVSRNLGELFLCCRWNFVLGILLGRENLHYLVMVLLNQYGKNPK